MAFELPIRTEFVLNFSCIPSEIKFYLNIVSNPHTVDNRFIRLTYPNAGLYFIYHMDACSMNPEKVSIRREMIDRIDHCNYNGIFSNGA